MNVCPGRAWLTIAITVKLIVSPVIFQFGPQEMETSNFTANCAKSAQFANPHSESREISAIQANF